ncbi:signal transduction protein PmrD [Citrobacter sp. HN-141]|uniref:signal transduction protein PmrD n=1 Tax=unclassified Citrobacter TaxID=2644389 RepID=UPI0010C96D1B|nr:MULTISPECIES: signal transduction protein PmrD [unclassified Citrobacter]MDW2642240.1 signal transduction protein PmrD [Citrobacter sp. HN-141]MDW2651587.1 signal transduction protein PmrD [Citrobacter sp. HN-120]MDW2694612.1 signal transduction protein PmrD [Citrobacter sp. HN-144]TKV06347.1 signal transduction protein PmrD [Citrobacter sp. wls619]
MEWHVKKSCCNRKAGRLYIVLCDTGGSLKMLAEAQACERVKVGDLLSPLKDAQYCINRDTSRVIKIIDARQYLCEEWERLRQLSDDK